MKVTLNNRTVGLSETHTLDEFLASQLQSEADGLNGAYAVAINMQFVPKANYASTELQNGDVIELLAPMQGG